MNIIIMPVIKSAIINTLSSGNSFVFDFTNNKPMFKRGVFICNEFKKLRDVMHHDIAFDIEGEYDKYFFYTNMKYSDNAKIIKRIAKFLGKDKCYFFFKEM